MSDPVESYILKRQPTAARPLLGLTVLLVEDSRYASEAVRLMCLRSGARIRRADCLASAHRHMRSYRPSVVIVDLGLPDGAGEDLIRELAADSHPVQAILATSGDPDGRRRAEEAGAQGFLEKPVSALATFQQTILGLLPPEARPLGLRSMPEEVIVPDPIAFRDDIAHIDDLLRHPPNDPPVHYIAQFLAGLARSAKDDRLCAAADALRAAKDGGGAMDQVLADLHGLLQSRLDTDAVV